MARVSAAMGWSCVLIMVVLGTCVRGNVINSWDTLLQGQLPGLAVVL